MDEEYTQNLINKKILFTWGYGSHQCLGRNFATIFIKILWIILFSKYNLKLINSSDTLEKIKFGNLGTSYPSQIVEVEITKK